MPLLRNLLLAAALMTPFLLDCSWAENAFPIDSKIEIKQSPYTDTVLDLIRKRIAANQKPTPTAGRDLEIQAYETKGVEYYIGARQVMVVNSPLEKLGAVVSNFEKLKELVPDIKNISVVSREQNKVLTKWIQRVPVFFIPNIEYFMTYLIDGSKESRWIFRYGLSKAEKIKQSDGTIILEKIDADHTLYLEYDFFDAEWGLATTLAPDRIWKDSMMGFFHADEAIRQKSEHPAWSEEKSLDEAKKIGEAFDVKKCVAQKVLYQSADQIAWK